MKIQKNKLIIIGIIILVVVIGLIIFIVGKVSNNGSVDPSSLEAEFTKYQTELTNYLGSLDKEKYDPNLICANSENVICGKELIESKTKFDIIPSLKNSKYKDIVNVADGKIDIKGLNTDEYLIISEVIPVSEYDYEYCITEYKEAKGLNTSTIVDNLESRLDTGE